MFQDYWGLKGNPFPADPLSTPWFQSAAGQEASARLRFLVDQQRRLAVLVGNPGSGKTWLLASLAAELRDDGKTALRIDLAGLDGPGLLRELASQLDIPPATSDHLTSLRRAVDDGLAVARYQNRGVVLLLDHASLAPADVEAELLRLAKRASPAGLTLILALCHRGLTRLGWQLQQLIHLRAQLDPWDLLDVNGFISAALAREGRKAPAFDDRALETLTERCEGLPRRLVQLAELSLVAAAAQGLRRVDRQTIEQVDEELLTGAVATAAS